MKKLTLAIALTAAATTAFAGDTKEPEMEPPVIVQEAQGSSSGMLLPLVLLGLVGVAVAAG